MCRNITELRGLEPPATDDEVEAAARQFIRKVSGLQKPPAGTEAAYERAIAHVTAEVHALLDVLPDRRQPPATVPPLRRPEVRGRIAAREAGAVGTSPAGGPGAAPRRGGRPPWARVPQVRRLRPRVRDRPASGSGGTAVQPADHL